MLDIYDFSADAAAAFARTSSIEPIEAKQRAEAAMEDATENQDISATQAALAESMAQLQMISKMRGKKV
jgi:F-type H+-transporting ATPase subunit epsilon